MKERKIRRVLIDAGVLLAYPDIISKIRGKNNLPVLLAQVMTTLIQHRGQPTVQGQNAERVLSQIEGGHAKGIASFPTGEPIRSGDLLAKFRFDDESAFILKRQVFTAQGLNAQLIEVARDYGMAVVTCDDHFKGQAETAGVACHKWPPQTQASTPTQARAPRPSPVPLKPFVEHRTPMSTADVNVDVKMLPGSNDAVVTPGGKRMVLGKKISEGGEGVIYETDTPSLVCKIYHKGKMTRLKRQKIELMVSRKINREGICWPTDLLFNQNAEFVGYVMPKAQGKTVQVSMFVKPVLEKSYPTWGRIDLLNLCLAFLEHIRFLHSLNILVGDINPMNLLVTHESTKLWLVDTDSFQIEGFPCPVGTVNFTAPEIQGVAYESFLRTRSHELFAVATMLFMILLPGKPPYSQQGGGSPSDNIKAMKFPYRDFSDKDKHTGENAPRGSWEIIWNHLKKDVREAFHRTFRQNDRVSIEQWIDLLSRYRFSVKKGYLSNEIFPTSFFMIRDPVEVACGKCSKKITTSKKNVEIQASKGRKVWCQDCHKQYRLKRMAEESYKEGIQAEQQNQGRPVPPAQSTRPASAPRPMAAPAPARAAQPVQAAPVRPSPPKPMISQPQPSRVTPARPHTPQPTRPQPIHAQRSVPEHPKQQSKVAELLSKFWRAIFD